MAYRYIGTGEWDIPLGPLGIGAMAIVASYIPAFRATRLDPAHALRND